MCKIGGFYLYSGQLLLNDMFLARGVGTDEDTCKSDTYGKAMNLALNGQVSPILYRMII